jgi:hypothetical protein
LEGDTTSKAGLGHRGRIVLPSPNSSAHLRPELKAFGCEKHRGPARRPDNLPTCLPAYTFLPANRWENRPSSRIGWPGKHTPSDHDVTIASYQTYDLADPPYRVRLQQDGSHGATTTTAAAAAAAAYYHVILSCPASDPGRPCPPPEPEYGTCARKPSTAPTAACELGNGARTLRPPQFWVSVDATRRCRAWPSAVSVGSSPFSPPFRAHAAADTGPRPIETTHASL